MIDYRTGYHPRLIGRVRELHGRYYGRIRGPVPTFEGTVACELEQVVLTYHAAREQMRAKARALLLT